MRKGKRTQGGPEGFRASEARGRCAFCGANSPPAGSLRGAELATREDRGAAAGKASEAPI